MSRHWPWFPSEGHIDTGRLCSAGSRCHPVPRRPRSYAALRLPASFGHRSGSPCVWPTSMRVLVLCLMADDTCTRNVACVGDGSPALRETGKCRGEARASQVTGPSSSCVPWSNTPPDTLPSSPKKLSPGMVVAFRENRTLGIREGIGFGAAFPWPTCSHAYASPALFPRPAQGLLPARAGSPLAGQDSHLLDDTQSFMESLPPPIPFDPQGLVALLFLSVCLHQKHQALV